MVRVCTCFKFSRAILERLPIKFPGASNILKTCSHMNITCHSKLSNNSLLSHWSCTLLLKPPVHCAPDTVNQVAVYVVY